MPIRRARTYAALVSLLFVCLASLARAATPEPLERAKAFIKWYDETIRPLHIAENKAYWVANNTGKDADYAIKERASNATDHAMSNAKRFAEIKAIKADVDAGRVKDPAVARQIELLYLAFLGRAVDPALLTKINAKASAAEKKFNNFRAKVGNRQLSSGDIYDILRQSTDSRELEVTWLAAKAVGPVVEKDLRELVALRNQSARKLGYANYHQMALALDELDSDKLLTLFDQLDALTRDQFAAVKAEMDELLAKRLGIKTTDLMPWHYQNQYFQEAPSILPADFDAPFKNSDVVKLAAEFYRGIGLPIDDVIKNGDMYERPGKNQEAFALDVDNAGEVRVLQNVQNDAYWMDTSLHEFGHSVYMSTYIPATLPYTLRANSHTFTTEGLAMLMGRLARNPLWIQAMGLKVADAKAFGDAYRKRQRWDLLVFSRWCQVMLRFEKAMYENPSQNLNKLWWDLVEKYQLIHRPPGRNAPDYATKPHIVLDPVYYHNYELGELYASQLREAIGQATNPDKHGNDLIFVGDKRVGKFLREKMFNLGALYRWDRQVEMTTGKPLTPDAFAKDLE